MKLAVIGLGKCIKTNFDIIIDNIQILNSIFTLSFFPKSEFVRNNILYYLENYFKDPRTFSSIINFIAYTPINTIIEIETVIMIFSKIYQYHRREISELEQTRSFLQHLNEQVIRFDFYLGYLKLAPILASFMMINYEVECPNIIMNSFQKLFSIAESDDFDEFSKFSKAFIEFIEIELNFMIINGSQPLIESISQVLNESLDLVKAILNNDAINILIGYKLFEVCDSLLNVAFPVISQNSALINDVITDYCEFIDETYNIEGDACDLLTDNYFLVFSKFIDQNNEIFEHILGIISSFSINDITLYISLSLFAAKYSISRELPSDEVFSMILEVLQASFLSESNYIRSAAASFINIYSELKDPRISVLTPIIYSLINENVSEQLIVAFSLIIQNDPKIPFIEVIELMFSIINEQQIELIEPAFKCIIKLIQKDKIAVLYHFETVLELFTELINAENDIIVQNSLCSICLLNSITPEREEIDINQVFHYLAKILEVYMTENDTLQTEILNSLSLLIETSKTFPEDLHEPIMQLILEYLGNEFPILQKEFQNREEFKISSNDLISEEDLMSDEEFAIRCENIALLMKIALQINNNQDSISILQLFVPFFFSFTEESQKYLVDGINSLSLNDIDLCLFLFNNMIQKIESVTFCEYHKLLSRLLQIIFDQNIDIGGLEYDLKALVHKLFNGELSNIDVIAVILANHEILELFENVVSEKVTHEKNAKLLDWNICKLISKSLHLFSREFLENMMQYFAQNPTNPSNSFLYSRVLTEIMIHLEAKSIYEQMISFSISNLELLSNSNPNEDFEIAINSCLLNLYNIEQKVHDFPYSLLNIDQITRFCLPSAEIDITRHIISFMTNVCSKLNCFEKCLKPFVKILCSTPKMNQEKNIDDAMKKQIKNIVLSFISSESQIADLLKSVFEDELNEYYLFMFESNIKA